MADTRGTWSLSEAWAEKAAAEWIPIPNVWTLESLDDAGYIAGGEIGPGPHISRYDKIAYSTDTKSTLTDYMYTARRGGGGSSSPTAGYLMGGFAPSVPNGPYSSSVDKLTYATQTTALVPSNFADSSTFGSAGGGSTTAGYLLQGGNPMVSYVRKITYATDAISLLPARVPNPRGANTNAGSSGNGDDFLYIMGGSDGAGSEVKKLTYSNDSVSSMPNMPQPGNLNRMQKPGCSSSDVAAYLCGGSNPYNSRIDKITFSNDTCTYVTNSSVPTPSGRMKVAGTGLPSAGYFSGGTSTSITEKITMSTESCSRIPALDLTAPGINQGTAFGAKGDNHPAPVPLRWLDDATKTINYGVFHGGKGPTGGSAIDKLDYSTETMENVSNLGGSENVRTSSGGSSATKAYFLGGRMPSWPWSQGQSFVWKMVYSTSTTTYSGGSPTYLPARGYRGVGLDSSDATYTTNWDSPTNWGYMYKVDHATDNPSYVPALNKSAPSQQTYKSMASSNISDETAYITAGSDDSGQPGSGSYISTTEKITFSSSTRSKLPGSHYPILVISGTAIGGPTAGYFGTGYAHPAYTSTLYKLTNSTETFSSIGNLEGTGASNGWRNERKGALGGNVAGYFFGGYNDTYMGSNVDKFVYSTDTISNLPGIMPNPGQPDPYQRDIGAGTASVRANNRPNIADPPVATPTASSSIVIPATLSDNGYYIGGDVTGSGLNSQVLKLTYASETSSALSAKIPAAIEEGQACNSATAGYSVGGSAPGRSNTTARITMSNDAIANVPGANTPNPVNNGEGVGTVTNGYIFCGATPSATSGGSQIYKMTYSNESFATSPANWTGPGSSNIRLSAYCNSTNGYMVGGELPSNYNGYVRYVFSTDTTSTIPATLSSARKETGGVGYENVAGYCTGGNPATSRTDKLTYSTETSARVPSADQIIDDIYQGVINGNRTAGYWSCSTTVTVQKLTYQNETYTAVPGATLPGNNRKAAAGFSAKGNNGGKVDTPNTI